MLEKDFKFQIEVSRAYRIASLEGKDEREKKTVGGEAGKTRQDRRKINEFISAISGKISSTLLKLSELLAEADTPEW